MQEITLKGNTLTVDGKEVDLDKSTLVYKSQLPKTWEELNTVEGYYVGSCSTVNRIKIGVNYWHKSTFATKDQAKASIAMAQLTQLMAAYNDGWVPDWTDGRMKYCLAFNLDKIKDEVLYNRRNFLAFKTAELRDEFLKNFEDLILQAKPLL